MPTLPTCNQRLVTSRPLIVIGLALLLGAEQVENPEWRERWQRIAELSSLDKDRLKSNLLEFENLTEERRQQYREIHKSTTNDPELAQVLSDYFEWLKTLSPYQRTELREETDDQARLALVRSFRAQQEERREDSQKFMRQKWAGRPKLSSEDFRAVIGAIESWLHLADRTELEKLQGFRRDFHLVRQALPLEYREERVLRLPAELNNAIVAAIADEQLREWLKEHPTRERQRRILHLIVGGLWGEFREIWEEQYRPTDEEIENLIPELDAETRDQIFMMAPWQAKHRLYREHLRKRDPAMAADREQLRKLSMHLFGSGRSRDGGIRGQGPRRRVHSRRGLLGPPREKEEANSPARPSVDR